MKKWLGQEPPSDPRGQDHTVLAFLGHGDLSGLDTGQPFVDSWTLFSCSALCGLEGSKPAWELVARPFCLGLCSLGSAWQPRPWGWGGL